ARLVLLSSSVCSTDPATTETYTLSLHDALPILTARAVDLITNKRAIKSTILAEDGQVVVLGGLIQDDVTRSESKVPLLGDIPLLGRLFRSTKDTHIKRNLMVFLRPSVVRDAAGLAALSGRKYSDIRILSNGSRTLLLPPS